MFHPELCSGLCGERVAGCIPSCFVTFREEPILRVLVTGVETILGFQAGFILSGNHNHLDNR